MKSKEDSPIESRGTVWAPAPCFLNSFLEPGCSSSNLSLRLGQWFVSNGIIHTMFIKSE